MTNIPHKLSESNLQLHRFFLNAGLRICLLILERGREWAGERERETSIGCLEALTWDQTRNLLMYGPRSNN